MHHFSIDFIGIGAQRCGTTSLAKAMGQHPQICMSQPKEVRYFNLKTSYSSNATENKNYYKDLNWYEKHFLHCGADCLKGEFSALYLLDKSAPKRIYDLFPNAKLIVSFRNPVDRAYSQYRLLKYYGNEETRDFDAVVREEAEYIERGLYYKQLKRYLRYFDMKQIFVVFFEEFIANPNRVMQRLFSFLNVDETFLPEELIKKSNQARKTRSIHFMRFSEFMTQFLVEMRMSSFIDFLKTIGVNKLVQKINSTDVSYSAMKNNTREFLQAQFINDIKSLEKLLKRDLSCWKI
jgi:hypothetical protein